MPKKKVKLNRASFLTKQIKWIAYYYVNSYGVLTSTLKLA